MNKPYKYEARLRKDGKYKDVSGVKRSEDGNAYFLKDVIKRMLEKQYIGYTVVWITIKD